MKNAVIVKSFQNGISVYLDPELPFEDILNEIAFKFRESSHFFQDTKMAISLEGRALTDEEERLVLNTISSNSDLHIVCLIGKDEETNQNYLKALQQLEYNSNQDNEGHFYRGTLKNGQILETESSIVVLGDVYPGSTIISTKDIIILGGLFGKAYAGGNGSEGHFVVALEMSPERLQVGDFKYKSNERQMKWSIKPKIQPKIAYVKKNKVVMEPITKELLSDLPL